MDDVAATIRDAERDIAHVLVEALLVAPDLRRRFLADAGLPEIAGDAVVAPARRPPSADDGLDLTLTVDQGGLRLALAVAVRLTGAVRASLAARAAARAMVASGRVDSARLVLVRPAAPPHWPAGVDAPFDAVLTIERIAEALSARRERMRGELAARAAHHEALLARALETGRLCGEAIDRRDHASFVDGYLALLDRAAPSLPPGLGMKPGGRPPDNGVMVFGAEALPAWPFLPQTRLAHHLGEGAATILLYGWGAHLSALAAVMAPSLETTPYRLAPAAARRPGARPGLLIVAGAPEVDVGRPADDQRAAILAGIAAVEALRGWFAARKGAARYWAELVVARDGGDLSGRILRDLALS